MSLEIRPIRDDEVEESQRLVAYAFNNTERWDLAPVVERFRRFYTTDWSLAAFEDGEMSTFMMMLPFAMRLNGRALPFAAVGPVVSSAVRRRQGHTGEMLKASLRLMRERGQMLSGLYTPHPALYRRYGWEIASEARMYSFPPKDLALRAKPAQRGRFRQVKPEDWPMLDRVYRRYASDRNGPLHRGDVWWQAAVLGTAQNQPFDALLWEDDSGDPQGYAIYVQPQAPAPQAGKLVVREFIALSGDAYLRLLQLLASHDLASEITIRTSVDDPLITLFEESQRLTIRHEYTAMLRVCDFQGAMKVRQPADPDAEAALTLEIADASAPWNNGVWRVQVSDGQSSAEPASGPADIALNATALAAVFNGYVAPSTAARAGLLRATSDDALARADAVFAVTRRPYFTDYF